MLNKIVKISNYQLIQFFYPDMKVRTELSLVDRDNSVLYVGNPRPKLKDWLKLNTKEFISVSGPAEVDFTNPEVLVKWVYAKREKEPPQRVLEQIKTMELADVEYYAKVYSVCGRWITATTDLDVTIYNLFQESVNSVKPLLQTYFALREIYPYEVIETSFVTFLSRVISIEEQNVSVAYSKVLKQANQRFGPKIRPLIMRLGQSEDNELEFINLLLDLR